MKPALTRPLIALGATLLATPVCAGESLHSTHVIKIATGDAEVIEADMSDLGVGESLSFTTDSGRIVDVLRGADGIELFLDGELIDAGAPSAHDNDRLALHEKVIIACSDDDDACSEAMHRIEGSDSDINVFVARHDIEVVCDATDDCDQTVWIESDGEHDLETLHESGHHKVIVIRKEEIDSSD